MPSVWRRKHWPPSPSVEDEVDALAHEVNSVSTIDLKSDDQAPSRGTVDQVPIILDVKHPNSQATGRSGRPIPVNDESSVASQSSDESHGPPTPRSVRFSHDTKTAESSKSASTKVPAARPDIHDEAARSKQSDAEEKPRGRPQVTPIDTGLAGDLQEMITGRRRAPSPYSFTKPEPELLGNTNKNRFSGGTFLSPDAAPPRQHLSVSEPKRSSSTTAKNHHDEEESATDNGRRNHRHHSRRRSTMTEGSEREVSRHRDRSRQRDRSRHRERRDSSSEHERRRHRERADSHTKHEDHRERHRDHRDSYSSHEKPRERPHRSDSFTEKERSRRGDRVDSVSSREKPRHREVYVHDDRKANETVDANLPKPAADERGGGYDTRKRQQKRFSKSDSPYSSSAEDGKPKHRDYQRVLDSEDEGARAKTRDKLQRPALDQAFSRHSFDVSNSSERKDEGRQHRKGDVVTGHPRASPDQIGRGPSSDQSSARTSKGLEDYFDKAFNEHKRQSYPSPRPSPIASPEPSPPMTPSQSTRKLDRYVPGKHLVNPSENNPGGISKSRTPSRANTLDLPSAAAIGTTSGASKPPARPPKPTRTASDAYHGKTADSITNAVRSKVTSGLPSPIEVPPHGSHFHRASSFASPTAHSTPTSQRSFSYSSNESHRSSTDDVHKVSSSYRLPDLQMTAMNGSSHPSPRPSRSTPSSQEKVPRVPPFSPAVVDLSPCPRSQPVEGYHDWYTITGLPELDICPSCMKSIGSSRFRDYCIPSLPKGRNQKIRCALSEPWIRQAWIQTIKQRKNNLEMLQSILRVPSMVSKSCPGTALQARQWHRLPNPETGEPIHNFNACSACVRSVEIVLPQLQGVFKLSSSLLQERTCDLKCNSKRFDKYMQLLDEAAVDYDVNRLTRPDVTKFANHARRTARLRECTRDDLVLESAWHFIPELPELTICEECYEHFIFPLRDKPIARDVSRTLRHVPNAHGGLSCQLYSERMRRTFLEAVKHNGFSYLKSTAQRRFNVEKLLQDKHRRLQHDQNMGIDRTTELARNIEEWKRWE